MAVLPSFVFVPFVQLELALDLGQARTVPRSKPFTFNGHRPALPVEQLAGLRLLEAQKKPLRTFAPGEIVRLIYGPLHGQLATIVRRKGSDRWLVEVGGAVLSVPAFLIQDYKRHGQGAGEQRHK